MSVSHLAALVLLWSTSLAATGEEEGRLATSPSPTAVEREHQEDIKELSEVLVSGQKPVRSTQLVLDWLAKLGGKFTFEGNVDLRGSDAEADMRPVSGLANCVAFGLAPGIRCDITVRWPEASGSDSELIPGGVSTLDPGMILYGLEPRSNGVSFMIVDNKGVGEHAVGLLFSNTLVSRTPCAIFPGVCERVVRITIEPDAQIVRIQIDLYRDYRRALNFEFIMRRVPGSKTDVLPGAP